MGAMKADAIVAVREHHAPPAIRWSRFPTCEEAEASKAAAQEVKQLPFSFLFTKKMLPRTIVACTICFVNFVCVYTIVTWTPTIFVSRGFDVTYSVALTTIMLLGIPVGVALLSVFVDKLGRKIQLVVGFVLTAIFGFLWTLIPVDQTVLIIVVGFLMTVITYYWSLICSSVYLPEPFPTQIRVRGAGFANAFGRIGAILNPIWIAFFLNSGIGAVGVYLASGGIAIVGAVIVGASVGRGPVARGDQKGVLEGERVGAFLRARVGGLVSRRAGSRDPALLLNPYSAPGYGAFALQRSCARSTWLWHSRPRLHLNFKRRLPRSGAGKAAASLLPWYWKDVAVSSKCEPSVR
ncbi:MAG: MFS transporter [Eggerthellaceae bacterium]